jgi:hypothetical protein
LFMFSRKDDNSTQDRELVGKRHLPALFTCLCGEPRARGSHSNSELL